MSDERWYEQIESRVLTLVRYRMQRALNGKVSKTIKFTTDGESDAKPYFPTCYMHALQSLETGGDLEGKTVNAVIATFEVQTYCRDRQECILIMNEAAYQMKQLAFEATAMPIVSTTSGVATGVARFRRTIGGGDIDIVGEE